MEQFNINIYEQYINTNIEELINGKNEIKKFFILNAIKSLKHDVMDLKTAKGNALDMWGKLLRFSRYIPIATKDEIEEYELLYSDFTFDDKNFVNLKFFNSIDTDFAELNDSAYRLILQLLLQSRNVPPNITTIAKLVSEILNVEVTIRDNFDMSFTIYYKKNNLDRWLQFIINKYDILPRPAGVKINFISSIWKIFGFRTDDEEYNIDVLTNFWNAQFEGGRLSNALFNDEMIDADNIKNQIDDIKNNIVNLENKWVDDGN